MNEVENNPNIKRGRWKELTPEYALRYHRLLVQMVAHESESVACQGETEQESAAARRGVAEADPQQVRIYLQALEGFIFQVLAEVQSDAKAKFAAWLQPDAFPDCPAVRREARHPVYGKLCLTDFYLIGAKDVAGVTPAPSRRAQHAMRISETAPARIFKGA